MLRMKDIISKLTLPGGLFGGCCAGMFSVAKACTVFPQHRRLVGCGLDPECVASSTPQFAVKFARQVLNGESDITEDSDVQQTTSTFVETMEKLDVKRRIDVWETLTSFLVMQTFLLHLLHHLL